ncbi:MGMT family protein [Virgibacillus sp. 179-BFC.A HS]|uniref:MGMT family protein n=1 Tax=Tigheibacillus jepli TaxID=3035914 RepID=A0ABU5CEW3_9BACI|nr:MGMT family protein [Virgibacillus sp. 179-BFC.A HS]MDY0404397.1 MGMT family protein [Virgibacillus sp. 179-BFC.A HS]
MQPFTEKVIHIIQNIPSGKVMTYGQIATLAGSPRAARQVVRILHTMSRKYELPWHRVVNKQGAIVLKDEEMAWLQRERLESEGVEVSFQGQLDLSAYQWND